MPNLTTELTDLELRAFRTIAADPQEWATNAIKTRVRNANKMICQALFDHCNENEIAMAVGQTAQIQQAFDLGIVEELPEDSGSAVSS